MPYAAATRTHVHVFRPPCGGAASCPHLSLYGSTFFGLCPGLYCVTHCGSGSLRLACGLDARRLWVRIGACSVREARRALIRVHQPPHGSASAFSTTSAQEGHGPWVTQVRSPVLATLILPLGLPLASRVALRVRGDPRDDNRRPQTDDNRRRLTDEAMTDDRQLTGDDD